MKNETNLVLMINPNGGYFYAPKDKVEENIENGCRLPEVKEAKKKELEKTTEPKKQ